MGLNDDQLTPSEHDDVRARLLAGTKRIKPVGAHRGAIVTTTVSVALVAVLSVGAIGAANFLGSGDQSEPISTPTPSATTPPRTPTLTPAPTPTSTPTPTAPARIVSDPTSLFSFDCADIAEDVAVFFDGEVPAVASELPHSEGRANWLPGPAQFSYAQAGALTCEYGASPTEAGPWARVVIVPGAVGALEDRAATLGDSDVCSAASPCELIDGSYVEVNGEPVGGPDDHEGRVAAGDAAGAAVRERLLAGVVAPSSSWQPPTGSTPIRGDCESFLPAESIATLFNVTGVSVRQPFGGWGMDAWMISSFWDATPCYYQEEGADLWSAEVYGGVTWLPGGEWAYRLAASGDPVALSSPDPTDEAVFSCDSTEYSSCVVDILADGNWIRYSLPVDVAESERAAIISGVAAVIVGTVRGA